MVKLKTSITRSLKTVSDTPKSLLVKDYNLLQNYFSNTIYKTTKGRLFPNKSRKSTIIIQNDRVHNLRVSLFIS